MILPHLRVQAKLIRAEIQVSGLKKVSLSKLPQINQIILAIWLKVVGWDGGERGREWMKKKEIYTLKNNNDIM